MKSYTDSTLELNSINNFGNWNTYNCIKFVNIQILTKPLAFFAIFFSVDDFKRPHFGSLIVTTTTNKNNSSSTSSHLPSSGIDPGHRESSSHLLPMDLKVEGDITNVEDMLRHSKLTEKSNM